MPFTMMFLELHDMFVYCDDGVRFTCSNIEAYCAFYGKVDHALFDWHVTGKI